MAARNLASESQTHFEARDYDACQRSMELLQKEAPEDEKVWHVFFHLSCQVLENVAIVSFYRGEMLYGPLAHRLCALKDAVCY